jgi:hypothetical protein
VASSNTVTVTSTATVTATSTSGGGGAGGGSAAPTITFGGTLVQAGVGPPLSSVEVCVDQHPEITCTFSDSSGHFSIQVPGNAEVAITFSKAGFTGVVVPVVTSTADQTQWEIGIPPFAMTQGFYEGFSGAAYPAAATGFLQVEVDKANTNQVGLAGAVLTLSPSSGEGPIYADPSFMMADPLLQATSGIGFARFANVAPGVVEVQIGPSTLSCASNFGGWTAPDANAARVPIVAGFETHTGFACF